MQNYERGELAKDILLASLSVGAAIGLTATLIAFPGLVHIFKLFDAKKDKDRIRIRQAVKRLERRGYLEIYKKEGNEYIKITPLGKQMMRERSIILARPPKPEKWDGLWRLVMFDIPEKNRKARNALRFALQKMGLARVQKSVFAYPYPCKKEIDFVAGYFKIRKGITYATANHIEGNALLKKKFRI